MNEQLFSLTRLILCVAVDLRVKMTQPGLCMMSLQNLSSFISAMFISFHHILFFCFPFALFITRRIKTEFLVQMQVGGDV